ncbi:MAG TPA: hypothetical protein VHC22_09910 [Pirellulales bacterium]|nr:hypothetical protein [Pirellulales bacterium]
MPAKRSATNPFYVLLVVFGIAFALTACAYSVMTLKAVRRSPEPEANGIALLAFLDQHGAALMGGELALLAATTVAAISTDRYWMRRAYEEHQANRSKGPPAEHGTPPSR